MPEHPEVQRAQELREYRISSLRAEVAHLTMQGNAALDHGDADTFYSKMAEARNLEAGIGGLEQVL
jgi:hypothetical protein